MSHRQELSTSSSYYCYCEPEFDHTVLRRHALDSPSTLCIRVASPLALGRNKVRQLHAQRRHVLGDDGRGSVLTASPFSYKQYDRGTCCRLQRQQYEPLLYKLVHIYVPGRWYGWSPYYTKKMKCLFLPRAAQNTLHSYNEVQK